MTRRPGLSLTEVLVALFIMALGTIAILTMFPLGALQMGQALKDDRTAQAAGAADGYLRWYWKKNVVDATAGAEPFVTALRDPNNSVPPTAPYARNMPVLQPTDSGPGYPVVIDPMGWVAPWSPPNAAVEQQYWLANRNMPRRTLTEIGTNAAYAQRVCSLLDGLTYGENGSPTPPGGGVIERELRYNWLWVVQRPDNKTEHTANMTVVVFDKRAFRYVPPNFEYSTTVSFTPGTTSIQVPVTAGVAIQKGGWVMDATIDNAANPPIRHALFYRVVSATENTAGTWDIELQTPIRRPAGGGQYNGTLVVLAGVSEVFERPDLTRNDY